MNLDFLIQKDNLKDNILHLSKKYKVEIFRDAFDYLFFFDMGDGDKMAFKFDGYSFVQKYDFDKNAYLILIELGDKFMNVEDFIVSNCSSLKEEKMFLESLFEVFSVLNFVDSKLRVFKKTSNGYADLAGVKGQRDDTLALVQKIIKNLKK